MFSRAIIYTALKIVFKRHGGIHVNIGPGVKPMNAGVLYNPAYAETEQAKPIEEAAARFLSSVIMDQVRNSHEAHYGKNIAHKIQSVIGIYAGFDDIFHCKALHHLIEKKTIHLNRQEFIDICKPSVQTQVQEPRCFFDVSTPIDELKVSIKMDPANILKTKQKGFDYMPSAFFQCWNKGERVTKSPIGNREQSMIITSILNAVGLSLFTPNSQGFLYSGSARFTHGCTLNVTFRKGKTPEFHACWDDNVSNNDETAFIQLEGNSKIECDEGAPTVKNVHVGEFLDLLEKASGIPIQPLGNHRTRPSCRTLLGHLVNIHTEPKPEWDDMLDDALSKARDVDELTSLLPAAVTELQRTCIYRSIQHPEGQGWF